MFLSTGRGAYVATWGWVKTCKNLLFPYDCGNDYQAAILGILGYHSCTRALTTKKSTDGSTAKLATWQASPQRQKNLAETSPDAWMFSLQKCGY